MDFGSFLKKREFEKTRMDYTDDGFNQGDPNNMYGNTFSGQHGGAFQRQYESSGPDTSYNQESYSNYSQHGRGNLHNESMNMMGFGGPRFRRPMRGGHPPNTLGRGFGRSTRGILKNRTRGRGTGDQSYAPKPQNYGYAERHQSFADYTEDDAVHNFTDDTIFSTQYASNENEDSYANTALGQDEGTSNSANEESPSIQPVAKDISVAGDEEEKDAAKAPGGANTTQEKKEDKEKNLGEEGEDENEDEDEDDEASKAINKLPASHNRGLMSTLIGMLGTEALNRKPDPLPPIQPAKLKDECDNHSKQKQDPAATTSKSEDGEGCGIMDLPAEERDLQPEDFDIGPSSDLFCKICQVQTTSLKNLHAHLEGKNHRAKLSSIAKGKIITAAKGGRKKVLYAKIELGKKSFVLEALEGNKHEPVIGLSFITEYHSVYQIMCVCNLCGVKFDNNAVLSHVSGSKHRYQYMKEKRPAEYAHLKRFGGKRTQLVSFLQELSVDVEKDDGRGEPVLKVFDTDQPNQEHEKKNPEGPEKEDNASVEGKQDTEQRNTKYNDETEIDGDIGFQRWVDAECAKSREAREGRASLSPPPRNERTDDMGHRFNRGGSRRHGFDYGDHPPPGPPRYYFGRGGSRPSFEGSHPPMFPHDLMEPHPHQHQYPYRPDDHFDDLWREPYPPRPREPYPHRSGLNPHFDDPYMDHRNFPRPPPSGPQIYPPREKLPPPSLPPHLDPDPVRRLDALKRAKQEAESMKGMSSRQESHLDPDPLKRLRKREAVQKPVVIDYSHGTAMNEKHSTLFHKKRKRSWDDDIKSILGKDKDKGLNNLAVLSNTYSSPEKSPPLTSAQSRDQTKEDKTLPFSKPYLDFPENKKKLKDLRTKAKSPPIPGFEKEPIQLGSTCKRSRSNSSSSSSSSSSESPRRHSGRDLNSKNQPNHSSRRSSQQQSRRGGYDLKKSNRRSRSRSPVKRSSSHRAKLSHSPDRSKGGYHSHKKYQTFNRNRDQKDSEDKKALTAAIGTSENPIVLYNTEERKAQTDKTPALQSRLKADSERLPFLKRGDGRSEDSKLSLPESASRAKDYRDRSGAQRVQNELDHSDLQRASNYRERPDAPRLQNIRPDSSRASEYHAHPGAPGVGDGRDRPGSPRALDYRNRQSERKIEEMDGHRRSRSKDDRDLHSASRSVDNHDRFALKDRGDFDKTISISPVQRNRDIISEDRERTSEQHKPAEETSYADDSEDAQAERIADMLLKMSSSLTSIGDTQSTLEALLSNPDLAETIIAAQSQLQRKSASNDKSSPSPTSERKSAGYEKSSLAPTIERKSAGYEKSSLAPTSESHHRESHHSIRRNPEPPVRERVAFSLSGMGRHSIQQSSAFAASSSDEEN